MDPSTRARLIGTGKAAAAWILAALAPHAIWWLTLEHLAPRPANFLGLGLQLGLGVLLGALVRNAAHAAVLVFVTAATREAPPLVLIATAAGAFGVQFALQPAMRKRLILALVSLVVSFPIIEAAARIRLLALDRAELQARLNSYYEVDPQDPHLYRPKAGYSRSYADLIAAARSGTSANGGRLKDERSVIRDALAKGLIAQDEVLHINALGFKGEEFPREKPGGERRVLCIGDSCTFGIAGSGYPVVADRILARDPPPRIRVINAGVEGYSPVEPAIRMPEYMALEPDVVLIYLGSNSLWSEYEDPEHPAPPEQIDRYLRSVLEPPRFFRLDSYTLFYRTREKLLTRGTAPASSGAPGAKRWEPFEAPEPGWPRYTSRAFERLIERMREHGIPAARILVATLPCLLRTDRTPCARALELPHLPPWARGNAYAFALAVERYNAFLRTVAAREGLRLVDLELWTRQLDAAPEEVFFDSIHMNVVYQVALGEHLAPIFREAARVTSPR